MKPSLRRWKPDRADRAARGTGLTRVIDFAHA